MKIFSGTNYKSLTESLIVELKEQLDRLSFFLITFYYIYIKQIDTG